MQENLIDGADLYRHLALLFLTFHLWARQFRDLVFWPLTSAAMVLGVSWAFYLERWGLNFKTASRDVHFESGVMPHQLVFPLDQRCTLGRWSHLWWCQRSDGGLQWASLRGLPRSSLEPPAHRMVGAKLWKRDAFKQLHIFWILPLLLAEFVLTFGWGLWAFFPIQFNFICKCFLQSRLALGALQQTKSLTPEQAWAARKNPLLNRKKP